MQRRTSINSDRNPSSSRDGTDALRKTHGITMFMSSVFHSRRPLLLIFHWAYFYLLKWKERAITPADGVESFDSTWLTLCSYHKLRAYYILLIKYWISMASDGWVGYRVAAVNAVRECGRFFRWSRIHRSFYCKCVTGKFPTALACRCLAWPRYVWNSTSFCEHRRERKFVEKLCQYKRTIQSDYHYSRNEDVDVK